MSVYTIPLVNAPLLGNLNQTVDLDGSDYQLAEQYNSREGMWYISLLDSAGNPLRSGLKIVVDLPILRLMMQRTRPPGELYCFNTLNRPDDPVLEDLNADAELGYIDKESIEAL